MTAGDFFLGEENLMADAAYGVTLSVTEGEIADKKLEDLFEGKPSTVAATFVHNLEKFSEHDYDEERETLRLLYELLTLELDSRQRALLVEFVIQEVSSMRLDNLALLPFVENEPLPQVITPALNAFITLGRPNHTNPFDNVKLLLNFLKDRSVVNRGAIHAGLASFGDLRVCAALRPYRQFLDASNAREFSSAIAPPLHRSTFEYCLMWANELAQDRDLKTLIHVASAIVSLVTQNNHQPAHDRLFAFGTNCFPHFHPDFELSYESLLAHYEPLLETLTSYDLLPLTQAIEIARDPNGKSAEDLERRKESSRRQQADRRASDRRIVQIAPHIERRARSRRLGPRRTKSRR